MSREDELSLRLHEAYESFSPSAEVEERVLARVLQAEPAGTEEAVETMPRGAERRVGRAWLALLPLAACLLLAVLLVRPSANTSSESNARLDTVAYEEEESVAGESATPVAKSTLTRSSLAIECPLVTLASGERMRVGKAFDGEVDESLAEAAEAASEDGVMSVACEVVRSDAGTYVRYEDSSLWYVLE